MEQKKKKQMGKYITFEKRVKRLEDMTPEEIERKKRFLIKNTKEVKTQMTTKELKKLKKKGIVFKPKGRIVVGDLYASAQVGREFRGNVKISKR